MKKKGGMVPGKGTERWEDLGVRGYRNWKKCRVAEAQRQSGGTCSQGKGRSQLEKFGFYPEMCGKLLKCFREEGNINYTF